uniref:FIIND domain-containing protein n=1 Tax=Sparus aurata TaxID=8175 RepID=A0A671Y5Z2_SPAAU
MFPLSSEKHYVEEDRPVLIQKVASMESVIELLLETLKDLSDTDLKEFICALLSQPEFHRPFLSIPLKLLQTAHVQDTVFFMVQIRGQKCVKKTEKILKTMKRTDLVQRLSDRSSGSRKQHSADEHCSALIHKVATIAAVQQLLLEILNDLSKKQLKKFRNILPSTVSQKNLPDISWMFNYRADIVNEMVHTYGQQSVELTREVFMDMKRTDLVQRLSKPSSGLKEKHRPSLKQRVETLESVIELLLKAMTDLTKAELKTFKSTLRPVYHLGYSSIKSMQQKAKYIPFDLLDKADKQDTVCLMVQYCGQQSVEMTKESLKKMRRTDLVQRLSYSSSRPKKKRQSAQIKKAATMGAVKELLLETLNDLSYEEQKTFTLFLQFTFFQRSLPQIYCWRLQKEDMAESLVDVMMQKYGQKSVEVTREVLIEMNRTDLVQRLSETSSELEEKHSVEEDWPALIQKVEMLESVTELLLEALKDLSEAELKKFKWNLCPIELHGASPVQSVQRKAKYITSDLLDIADMQGTMCLMVQSYGQQSVEWAREILKKMKRTDLVQRLSDSSSRPKKKLSVDELQSAQINKAATMGAVKELLLETLNDLSYEEQKNFTWFVQFTFFQRSLPQIDWSRLLEEDMAETLVDAMVQKYGQKSLEVTREVLMDMNRTDLVQRLSETSSGLEEKHSVEEDWPALIQKVESMESVIELLLETLKVLSNAELEKVKHTLLRQIYIIYGSISTVMLQKQTTNVLDTVFIIVLNYSEHVEMIKDILKTMKRTDLVQRLSDKKKHSADKHHSALIHKVATIAAVQQLLLEILNDLSKKQLKKFKNIMRSTVSQKNLPNISWMFGYSEDIVNQMVHTYGQQSVELTREAFMDMKRTDLVQRLSKPSSGLKGPSRSLAHEDFGSAMQDTRDWTKFEPEVNSTVADEAPTHSLQSEAGNFECSVSGLRWVCKEKVSFKYQFCSWEEPMERMESMKYMLAGPLIDITVNAGKLDVVFLPHWICIDNNPEIRDKFAVLHIDDCGDVVEKVAEVTSSHVKLSEPIFSPRAVLMKAGFPVKISCDVLIYYQPNTPFLKLHVYLIPHDPALQQVIEYLIYA